MPIEVLTPERLADLRRLLNSPALSDHDLDAINRHAQEFGRGASFDPVEISELCSELRRVRESARSLLGEIDRLRAENERLQQRDRLLKRARFYLRNVTDTGAEALRAEIDAALGGGGGA
jgi:hypothetical protein